MRRCVPKPAKGIPYIRARMVGHGCLTYLAHIKDVDAETLSIDFILVIYKFKELFPMDLPGTARDKDIEFCIYL